MSKRESWAELGVLLEGSAELPHQVVQNRFYLVHKVRVSIERLPHSNIRQWPVVDRMPPWETFEHPVSAGCDFESGVI